VLEQSSFQGILDPSLRVRKRMTSAPAGFAIRRSGGWITNPAGANREVIFLRALRPAAHRGRMTGAAGRGRLGLLRRPLCSVMGEGLLTEPSPHRPGGFCRKITLRWESPTCWGASRLQIDTAVETPRISSGLRCFGVEVHPSTQRFSTEPRRPSANDSWWTKPPSFQSKSRRRRPKLDASAVCRKRHCLV
jgi:hypothetical protein